METKTGDRVGRVEARSEHHRLPRRETPLPGSYLPRRGEEGLLRSGGHRRRRVDCSIATSLRFIFVAKLEVPISDRVPFLLAN